MTSKWEGIGFTRALNELYLTDKRFAGPRPMEEMECGFFNNRLRPGIVLTH